MSRQIANNSKLYDIESVEVLKGPQGTLYGRNTTGGAVRIMTQKPTDEFGGFVDVSYGDYETTEVSAKLNVPLTDNLFAKFTAFTIDQGEGFLENVTLNRDQWKRDATGVRAQFLYAPSDRTEILFTIDNTEDDTGGIVGSNKLSACCGDDLFKVESGLVNTWAGTDFEAYSLKATVDFDDVQLEIITSKHDLEHSFNNDYSDQPTPAYSIPNLSQHEQTSFEVNLSGEMDDLSATWVAGFSYYDEDSDVLFGDALYLFGGFVDVSYGDYETTEVSAKLNVPLTDNLFAKFTAFTIDQGEGFLENVTLNRDQWKRDATGVRAQFLYAPSDRTEILFTIDNTEDDTGCLLYTSPSPRDQRGARMPSSA